VIDVGIVGCGFIATIHAWSLELLGRAGEVDARLAWVHDRDRSRAERLARHHGGAVADDQDSLLDRVDAVWVCTWTAEHRAVVEAAAGRGLAVMCEKPLGRDLEEAEAVAAALAGVPHQVGLVLRAAPVVRELRRRLAAGGYGRHLATVLRDDQYLPVRGVYRSEWRADVRIAGGGTLLEHSIHDVDLLRHLLGDPVSVGARVAERLGHPGIDDTAIVTSLYPDGSTSTIASIWHQVTTRESSRRAEIFFEDALVWFDDDSLGPLHLQTAEGEEVVEPPLPEWAGRAAARLGLDPALVGAAASYGTAVKEFLDGLAAGRSGTPSAAEALAAHRLVDAAYRSSEAGGTPVAVVA
jgi:myo-inositol 2-dehydrogenase/D-chiro-inositol 1-dehydrogenase